MFVKSLLFTNLSCSSTFTHKYFLYKKNNNKKKSKKSSSIKNRFWNLHVHFVRVTSQKGTFWLSNQLLASRDFKKRPDQRKFITWGNHSSSEACASQGQANQGHLLIVRKLCQSGASQPGAYHIKIIHSWKQISHFGASFSEVFSRAPTVIRDQYSWSSSACLISYQKILSQQTFTLDSGYKGHQLQATVPLSFHCIMHHA